MRRYLISMLLPVVLAGCAATPDLPPNYALDASRPEGLAIVSLTLSGRPLSQFNSLELGIRPVSPPEEEMVKTTPHFDSAKQHARRVAAGGEARSAKATWSAVIKGLHTAEPLDIVEGGMPIGRVMAVRLPPGEYEVHSWKARERTSFGEMEYRPMKTFGHRFTVKPGVATYLGRLQLHLGDDNLQKLAISDQRDADLALFNSKHPRIGMAVMK